MASKSKQDLKQVLKIESKLDAFYTGGNVAWSSDGERIFCQNGTSVKAVTLEDGKVSMSFDLGEAEEVTSLALSPDDEILIIATKNDLLRQFNWRTAGVQVQRNWRAFFKTSIIQIAFDVDSRLLATGSCDGALKVWDIVNKYCTHNLKGAQGMFSLVKFHPIKHLVYGATNNDGTLYIWNLKESALIHSLEAHTTVITDIQFLDGKQKNMGLTSSRDKVVILWDFSKNTKLRTIPVFESIESLMVISKGEFKGISESHIVTAGNKGILKVWNIQTGQCIFQQDSSNAAVIGSDTDTVVTKAIFNKSTKSIAVVTYEHNIVLYSLDNKLKPTKRLIGYNDQVLDLSFVGREENYISLCTNSPFLKVLDRSSGHTHLLRGHADIVICCSVFKSYPDTLVTGSKDNDIRVWSLDNGEFSNTVKGAGHTRSVGAIGCINGSGKENVVEIVSGGEDTTLKLWRYNISAKTLSCKTTVRAHEKDINSIDISHDDQIVASASQDKTCKLWAIEDLTQLGVLRGHRRGVWCARFSPDEPTVATSSADTSIKLWSIEDFSCLRTFEGHECSVLKVLFLTCSQQLLTCGSDGNLKLWSVKTNECVATFDGHEDRVWALAADSSEETFLSGAADSTIRFWKDVTVQEREEQLERNEKILLDEQKLMNLIQNKKWTKALRLAINLEQPSRTLNILKQILYEEDRLEQLRTAMKGLEDFQKNTLLGFCVSWNTNSKHCYVAQTVCRLLLVESKAPQLLKKLTDLKEHTEGLIPYTERHHERIMKLQQQSMFIDYMLKNLHIAPALDS